LLHLRYAFLRAIDTGSPALSYLRNGRTTRIECYPRNGPVLLATGGTVMYIGGGLLVVLLIIILLILLL
jgi:hypothetical protein